MVPNMVTRRDLLVRAAQLGAGVQLGVGITVSEPGFNAIASLDQTGALDESLTVATNRVPTDLDPHSAPDPGSIVALNGQFETLIRLKPGTTDQFDPLIAQAWESNHDKSVWTFQLRDGVTFGDGTPCDAQAVRRSFERELALDFGPATVIRRFVQDVAQISTPDPRTVVFDLGRPQPLFDAAIAAPGGAVIVNMERARREEVSGDFGHAWAQTSTEGLGTGPYRITTFDPIGDTLLERNENYWGGWNGSHFERIILRNVPEAEIRRDLVEEGVVDIAGNISPEALHSLGDNPDLAVNAFYNLTVVYIALTPTGPLQSPSARQAICYAFPYDEVVNGVYEGFAKRAIGPCAELCRGFNPETFVYNTDLDRARALFDEAGVPQDTTLTMVVPLSSPWAGSIAELLRQNLEQFGIKLETQLADYATLISIYYGEMPTEERPHLMPSFWSPDYNDAWNHLWPQVSSEAWQAGNIGHYANPQVDTLLDQARSATDEQTYQAALSEVQQIVTRDDPAAIYMVQPQWPFVLRKNIGGFIPNAVNGDLLDFYGLYRQSA
jgi:peptide/nickel transport system substrate-binding protein